ncbi:Sperm-tail_PG-rich repeat [Hexamita inflata]|uniref:Sperm-tail PG-rich repeat n=1 Tax=Hexamita inflata TaxID=28002 RepID=A0AA86PUZ2_9EUKA|nr:Sperm-tail PG-rich repeat [Hexamita inflata]
MTEAFDSGRLPFATFTTMNTYKGSTQLFSCRSQQEALLDYKKYKQYEYKQVTNRHHNTFIPPQKFLVDKIGPGSYEVNLSRSNSSFVSNLPRYQYKQSNWSETLKPTAELKMRPGPSSYHNLKRGKLLLNTLPITETDLDKKRTQSALKQQREQTPAPNFYNPEIRKSVQSAKLNEKERQTKPFEVKNDIIPASNSYTIECKNTGIQTRLYRRSRETEIKSESPGPGTYNVLCDRNGKKK